MPALPQVVLNHHQNNPRTCFYDVFAEIDRAWASVDNTLYIWRIGDKYALACVPPKSHDDMRPLNHAAS